MKKPGSTLKLTFAKGASLKDPAKLFNSGLDGNARRSFVPPWPSMHRVTWARVISANQL